MQLTERPQGRSPDNVSLPVFRLPSCCCCRPRAVPAARLDAPPAADWEDVHPLEYLSPFLETVKSPETSGPITLVALSSLHKIISRGILGASLLLPPGNKALPRTGQLRFCVRVEHPPQGTLAQTSACSQSTPWAQHPCCVPHRTPSCRRRRQRRARCRGHPGRGRRRDAVQV